MFFFLFSETSFSNWRIFLGGLFCLFSVSEIKISANKARNAPLFPSQSLGKRW